MILEIKLYDITTRPATGAYFLVGFFCVGRGFLVVEISLPERQPRKFEGPWLTRFKVMDHLFEIRFCFLVLNLVEEG